MEGEVEHGSSGDNERTAENPKLAGIVSLVGWTFILLPGIFLSWQQDLYPDDDGINTDRQISILKEELI